MTGDNAIGFRIADKIITRVFKFQLQADSPDYDEHAELATRILRHMLREEIAAIVAEEIQ